MYKNQSGVVKYPTNQTEGQQEYYNVIKGLMKGVKLDINVAASHYKY